MAPKFISDRDGAAAELTPLKHRLTKLETTNKDLLDAEINAERVDTDFRQFNLPGWCQHHRS